MRIITLYSMPNCQQCIATKRSLDQAGATYRTVDVSRSPDDLAAIIALDYSSAPVVIVSTGDPETDMHWAGYQPDLIDKYTTTEAEAA